MSVIPMSLKLFWLGYILAAVVPLVILMFKQKN